ncbi:MAG: flagellar biosynthesis protein FlhA [Pseudomonadota bacterium]
MIENFRKLLAGGAFEGSDLALAGSVVAILAIMVLPLPRFVLDILLAFNLTFSVMILLMAIYTLRQLDFSIFPSLLLVTTLFRLSLNVASTRLILLHGHEGPHAAGRVIESFGNFVVGGNYVVGFIVFCILVVINFVVITKGAGRIAEVAARFTLDAMPGKQMSIDADMNAGLIDDKEARRRRAELSQESEFYGAMDGASKFVRGEAVAGLVIMIINVLGGLTVGIFQKGLGIATAARNYTLLTIGDGLISQVPAIIVSTAAGLIVSRAASDATMGKEFARQFSIQPRAMSVAGGVVLSLAMVPGLPTLPFMILGLAAGGLSLFVEKNKKVKEARQVDRTQTPPPAKSPESVEALSPLDLLGLEVGYGLIPLVDEDQGGELLERIRSIRRQFAQEMGVIVPPLHVRDNLQLKSAGYSFLLRGIEVARGDLMLGHQLAMDPGNVRRKMDGIPTKEPAFGLPALWVPSAKKEESQFAGYTVVDLPTVIATHLTEVIRSHAEELLGRQEVQGLLDNLVKTHPKTVEELIPNQLTLGGLQRVLRNLLRERVSIRDLLSIIESLADYAPMTKDPELLSEYVRQRLARSIVRHYQQDDGTLQVLSVEPGLEELLAKSIEQTEHGTYLSLEPRVAQLILKAVTDGAQRFAKAGQEPVVLCSPGNRRHLKRLMERHIPSVAVLSHAELPSDVKIKSLGQVGVGNVN